MRHHHVRDVVGLGLATLLVACGSGQGGQPGQQQANPGGTAPAGQGPLPTSQGRARQAVYSGQLEIQGGSTLTGGFETSPQLAYPCEAMTQAGTRTFPLPSPGRPVSGQPVRVGITITDFHGPGDYTLSDIDATHAVVTVGSDDYRASQDQTKVRISIGADASGSLAADAMSDRDHKQAVVSLSWTCRDLTAAG